MIICGVCSSPLDAYRCYHCSSPVIWNEFGENGEAKKFGKGFGDYRHEKAQQVMLQDVRARQLVPVELDNDGGHEVISDPYCSYFVKVMRELRILR